MSNSKSNFFMITILSFHYVMYVRKNKVRKGRPTNLNKYDKRFIVRKFVKYPHLNALKLTVEFHENFLLKFYLKLFDKSSEQLDFNEHTAGRKILFMQKVKSYKFLLNL